MSIPYIRLKKNEARRLRQGHLWIYSNEIDTKITPLKLFKPGDEVIVKDHQDKFVAIAYLNPQSLITARILTTDVSEAIDLEFFKKRISTALQLRNQLFPEPFYRLVFSEGDFLPGLIIDRFGEHFVLQINTAGMEKKLDLIIAALQSLFPDLSSILLRNDNAFREQEGLTTEIKSIIGTPPHEVLVKENGIAFFAPILQGQKTGWFYDHRFNRARLQAYVKNKRVLDVFSYLGGFGILAAHFGATKVDCIDSSLFATNYITKNAAHNKLTDKVNIINDDAFIALKTLVNAAQTYDVIVLDPPAFIKRAKDRDAGLIAYQRINELALKLLAPHGILIACSCSMHMSESDLAMILQRAAFNTNCQLQLLERGFQGPDHPIHLAIPETNYLKKLLIRKITKKDG